MNKVVAEFQIGKYKILKIDNLSKVLYKNIKIADKLYSVVPSYDMPDCIAIESSDACSFIGSRIELV